MTIIEEKYKELLPTKAYITDTVILAQAWKKTHKYMRRHNWYADFLELDASTLNLEMRLAQWSGLLESRNYVPHKLRLVLAPKTSKWVFPSSQETQWEPSIDKETQKEDFSLRPLAHLNVRDQTYATAAMLCLANAIETLQGPTEENDFLAAQERQIFSYGNRLQCYWESSSEGKSIAKFGWGNSKCYRMYFEDYQLFLKRPKFMCQYFHSLGKIGTKQYIVTLDLKSFYDRIDRNALLKEARRLYKTYSEQYALTRSKEDDAAFWEILKDIFAWMWDEDDEKQTEGQFTLPEGIPQGLVAGGFFANVYMIGFDQAMGELLHKKNQTPDLCCDFAIRDYCRYVDDIRMVVEVNENCLVEDLKKTVESAVSSVIRSHLKKIGAFKKDENSNLEINTRKTKVQSFLDISNQSDLSARMNMIQQAASGTPDIESLKQIIGDLDGLLQLSEQLSDGDVSAFNKLALSRIAIPNIDINSDTLKRFAAKRLIDALRSQSDVTVIPEDGVYYETHDNYLTTKPINQDFEIYARKLISIWAKNPSLSSLLKFGFDLYPDHHLLDTVLEALRLKLLNFNVKKTHKLAMAYVAADLLCASAVWISRKPDLYNHFGLDPNQFLENLAAFARELLESCNELPWYLNQQAALYLASLGKPYPADKLPAEKEMEHYRSLHRALYYETMKTSDPVELESRLVTALIAQQLIPSAHEFSTWFSNSYSSFTKRQQIFSLKLLCANRPDLMQEVLQRISVDIDIQNEIPELFSINYRHTLNNNLSLKINRNQSFNLAAIITSSENPFKQENALLLLIEKLLTFKEKRNPFLQKESESQYLSLEDIQIKFNNFESIQSLDKNSFEITLLNNPNSERFKNYFYSATWVKPECRWLYNLGAILRSCVTGEYDFTTHSFLMRHDHKNSSAYKGLRTTWFTRRFGMSMFSEGLFVEPFPLSPWMSELLLCMLQWPGVYFSKRYVHEFSEDLTPQELLKVIRNRKKEQLKLYGKYSKTPTYVLPVANDRRKKDVVFRTVIVQSLLPDLKNFNLTAPTTWQPAFRKKHKAHIMDMCNLVSKHLSAWQAANTPVGSNDRESNNVADLIVFPELSVHPNDIGLLKNLSRKTKASIFAGITFQNRPSDHAIINQAVWILYSDDGPNATLWQGKENMTTAEEDMNVQSHRPYQLIIEFQKDHKPIRVAGAICYDSTDLALAADLREISDMFVIAALNKDIDTFDNMITALNYHMYQPVVLANSGQHGGSAAYAPFKGHDKLISHVHGSNQLAISMFDIDPTLFKKKSKNRSSNKSNTSRSVKTSPAGFKGR